MYENFLEIEETTNTLDSLLLVLMVCMEKGDLPADAYVDTLGLIHTLVGYIGDRVRGLSV